MTGLNPRTESILSLACFVTDFQLNVLDDEGYEAVIHHPKSRLDQMDAWCTKTHSESGLTRACIETTTTAEQAADGLLRYVEKFCPEPGKALLAGNSIHADKSFLAYPPYDRVLGHLHYRLLDVSAMKEAYRRWASDSVLEHAPTKKGLHTAREDILESIEEAKWMKGLIERVGTDSESKEGTEPGKDNKVNGL